MLPERSQTLWTHRRERSRERAPVVWLSETTPLNSVMHVIPDFSMNMSLYLKVLSSLLSMSFTYRSPLFFIHLYKTTWALAGVAQWTEHRPANQRVAGSIPSQGTCLGCRPAPQSCKRQPHIDIFLPLFLSPAPSV